MNRAAWLGAWAAALGVGAAAGRQPGAGEGAAPDAHPQQEQEQGRTVRLEDLIPQVRLGARVGLVAQRLGVTDAVVIVPDAASFGAAVKRWSLGVRFPVLIDDGSARAREDIGRFVRAFGPAQVVRWSAPVEELAAWTGDETAQRAAFEETIASAWRPPTPSPTPPPTPPPTSPPTPPPTAAPNARDDAQQEKGDETAGPPTGLAETWRAVGLRPPGVVVTSMKDPAWTGALALAAGRGEIVAWVAPPAEGVSGEMPLEAADALSAETERVCEEAGFAWREVGDVIEAVTICLNCPARVRVNDDRKYLSLTDVIGRHDDTLERRDRWAWAGQVFGDEAEAAYMAMCSLFLQPRRAWLFDGYGEDAPWNLWDMIATKAELERANFDVMIDDGARRGRRDWMLRAAGKADGQTDAGMGVNAGLICVNTHGQAHEFNLDPGKLRAEAVPFLRVPSAVHFVHSFSAQRQGDRNTVAGRWLERGVFAYCGSVDEPHLQGFMPTPLFARRLVSAIPFGVAGRMDEPHPYARVWKIHIIGDPLFTLHAPPPRRAAGPERPEAQDLSEEMKIALKERRFTEAVRDLVMLGRDEDAVRLLRAIAAAEGDEDETIKGARLTADLAEAGLMAAFRQGDLELFVTLGNTLADAGKLDASAKDAVWHALRPALGTLREPELALLRRSVRAEMAADDVIAAAGAIRSVQGPEQARAYLAEARALVTDEAGRKRVDEELGKW